MSTKRLFANIQIQTMQCVFAICFVFFHLPSTIAQEMPRTWEIVNSFTEPISQSIAASAVSGIVAEIHIHEGDLVNAGDPIATLNSKSLRASLKVAEARAASSSRVDSARSLWTLRQSQLQALQELVAGGHTSPFELEQQQAETLAAHAELRAAEDASDLAKLEAEQIRAELAERMIVSPIAGYVTEIHKQLGEQLTGSELQFATIVRIDKLKIKFFLNAESLAKLQINDQVRVTIGQQQESHVAAVMYISPVIDADSGLGRLELLVSNDDLKIRSGIPASLHLNANSVKPSKGTHNSSSASFNTVKSQSDTQKTELKSTKAEPTAYHADLWPRWTSFIRRTAVPTSPVRPRVFVNCSKDRLPLADPFASTQHNLMLQKVRLSAAKVNADRLQPANQRLLPVMHSLPAPVVTVVPESNVVSRKTSEQQTIFMNPSIVQRHESEKKEPAPANGVMWFSAIKKEQTDQRLYQVLRHNQRRSK